jgi:hypothetical protein
MHPTPLSCPQRSHRRQFLRTVGGLDHSISRPDEIRLLGADRNRQALEPGRFDRVARDRPRACVLGDFIGPHESGAKRTGGQTVDGLQEVPAIEYLGTTRFHDAVLENAVGACRPIVM